MKPLGSKYSFHGMEEFLVSIKCTILVHISKQSRPAQIYSTTDGLTL